jgi:hypothetical protein
VFGETCITIGIAIPIGRVRGSERVEEMTEERSTNRDNFTTMAEEAE